MQKVKRPALRYHGGKWRLAPWIIEHFPDHRVYVEPYGGGASVLIRKPRSYAEVYNDLDSEVVNVFRVIRENGADLRTKLFNTPFSREEFELSYSETDDALEQARRTIIRSFMGFGSNAIGAKYRTGFRANSNRSGTTPAGDWKNYAECFDALVDRWRGVVIENRDALVDRWRGVVIENRDALEVIKQHDAEKTLHYIDPPYVTATRSDDKDDYRHEMTDKDHETLAETIKGLKGFVILSGYDSPLYDDLYKDFKKVRKNTHADGAKKRTEVLYLSENINQVQTLF